MHYQNTDGAGSSPEERCLNAPKSIRRTYELTGEPQLSLSPRKWLTDLGLNVSLRFSKSGFEYTSWLVCLGELYSHINKTRGIAAIIDGHTLFFSTIQ